MEVAIAQPADASTTLQPFGEVGVRSTSRAALSGRLNIQNRPIKRRRYTHHGELLQLAFYDGSGEVRRGLLTLPCPRFFVEAEFYPDRTGTLHILPGDKNKALRAAYIVREMLGDRTLGGTLILRSNIPPKAGGGESTGDVFVITEAVAAAKGVTISPELAAHLCVRAETASDSIMFLEAVLFAQRDGLVLERFGGPLPRALVLGVNPTPGKGVDTLAFPPAQYSPEEIEAGRALRAAARRAVQQQDVELIARVASGSARINERFLPNPAFPHLAQLERRGVSLGNAVAHSGTLAAAIFRPQDHAGVAEAQRVLEDVGFTDFLTFTIPSPREQMEDLAA